MKTCSIDECEKPSTARGWCGMHYARWRRHGDTEAGARPAYAAGCSVDGCDNGGKIRRGLCGKHWQRFRKHGDPLAGRGLFSTIEDAFTSQVAWDGEHLIWTGSLDAGGYGSVSAGGETMRAHRYSYEREHGPIPGGMVIDHRCWVPGCVLPAHLRTATRAENSRSRAGAWRGRDLPRGVRREGARFGASVHTGGRHRWLGTFDTVEEASAAAQAGRAELFGEFAGRA